MFIQSYVKHFFCNASNVRVKLMGLQAMRIDATEHRALRFSAPDVREGVYGRRRREMAEYGYENKAQWRSSGVDGASSCTADPKPFARTRHGVTLHQSALVGDPVHTLNSIYFTCHFRHSTN